MWVCVSVCVCVGGVHVCEQAIHFVNNLLGPLLVDNGGEGLGICEYWASAEKQTMEVCTQC